MYQIKTKTNFSKKTNYIKDAIRKKLFRYMILHIQQQFYYNKK